MIKGQPLRYLHGHAGAAAVRKKNRYTVDPETGCWIWNLYKSGGYGALKIGTKVVKAHRHYYEQAKGPIPTGYVIDHLCKRKDCVNPNHLEAVPNRVNTQRSSLAKIDQQKARMIRELAEKHTATELADTFGVGLSLVCDVIAGRTWSEPTPLST